MGADFVNLQFAEQLDSGGSMTSNELVLLDEVLERRQQARAEPVRDDDAFETFACEQALRELDVSPEDVEAGIVGGGNDGAIDGAFCFQGDILIEEDSEIFDAGYTPPRNQSGTRLLLWLIQAKRQQSFTETAIDLVASSTKRLLDLGSSEADLRLLYADAVVRRIVLFREALKVLAVRHPSVEVRFTYATRGNLADVNPKVLQKAHDLETQFSEILPDAVGKVELLGASELWRRATDLPSFTLELPYQENATRGTSHVALVLLRDYLNFLSGADGGLRRHIFDWNVRDYQGEIEVNNEIGASLLDPAGAEFWWLNNGVTVVCSKSSIIGKTYVLDDVQIVNGLQTSHTIYRVLKGLSLAHPVFNRSVLVRILVTSDAHTRDQVIRATNRQTSVPVASLRATDDVQRKIEAYFEPRGWYYDRRKKYYSNIGKSPEKIVSIPLLAQAVMAMALSQPNNSRARPSSLLKRDEDYSKIFSDATPLAIYLWVAKAQKAVDAFLQSEAAATTAPERTNLRFHLSMLAAGRLLGDRVRAHTQLARIAEADIPIGQADLLACLTDLRAAFDAYTEKTGDSADKAAKGSEFVENLLASSFPAPSPFPAA